MSCIHQQDHAVLGFAQIPKIQDHTVHCLLKAGFVLHAAQFDTGTENILGSVLGKAGHLFGFSLMGHHLGIGTVMNIPFVPDREHIDIKPEVKALRVNVGMHGFFPDRTVIAE